MKATVKKIAEKAIEFDKENKRNLSYFGNDKFNTEFKIYFGYSIYHFENAISKIKGVHTIEMYARNETNVIARMDSFKRENKIIYIFFFEYGIRYSKMIKEYFTDYYVEYGFINSYTNNFICEQTSKNYSNYSNCLRDYYIHKNKLKENEAVQIVKFDRLNYSGIVVKTTVKN